MAFNEPIFNFHVFLKIKANYKNKGRRNMWFAIFILLLFAPFVIGCVIGEFLIIITSISHHA